MDNATLILQTLDEQLDHEVRIVLYGRAALQLGFENPPQEVAHSQDVDCIIPVSELDLMLADAGFWNAQEMTNDKLRSLGLYITHLFRSDEVFLRADWLTHLVPITKLRLKWLRLFRPATVDLVLTKMMRGNDAQDLADIEFLIRDARITPAQMAAAFATVQIPDMVELRDAFKRAQPLVMKIAEANGK